MKALLLVGGSAGHGWVPQHKEKVLKELSSVFDEVEYYEIGRDMDAALKKAVEACSICDALLISGGDGTFNHVISAIAHLPKLPKIGYINGGTLCDVGKNFGIKGGPMNAIKIIKEGFTSSFDLIKVNDSYAVYMAAFGAFSDIAYAAKRNAVKRIRKLAYYLLAVKKAFKPVKVKCKVRAEGKEIEVEAPFVMILNGRNVGGFRVNRKASMNDGKAELFYSPKRGLFNGLVHYFFHHKITCIKADSFEVETAQNEQWCVDGERGPVGPAKIEVLQRKMEIFCKKPRKSRN